MSVNGARITKEMFNTLSSYRQKKYEPYKCKLCNKISYKTKKSKVVFCANKCQHKYFSIKQDIKTAKGIIERESIRLKHLETFINE